jgi:hypothetical protein
LILIGSITGGGIIGGALAPLLATLLLKVSSNAPTAFNNKRIPSRFPQKPERATPQGGTFGAGESLSRLLAFFTLIARLAALQWGQTCHAETCVYSQGGQH